MKRVADMLRLDGRVALITGGAGHIGLACAEALAEAGARIALSDLNEEHTADRASQLARDFGVDAAGFAVDLSRSEQTAALVDRVVERFGRLDILVNNAAFVGTSTIPGFAAPFQEQSIEAWDAAMRVNLTAPFQLAQRAQAALSAHAHTGAIINVGSIYGVVAPQWSLYEGTKMANPAAYNASKGGILQLTRYLASVMAPRVRVNCVSPGGVARGQDPRFVERYVGHALLGRMSMEEDLKGAFAYLASDAAAYVTGQHLLVDGGWTAV
ncbi:SDR family oxidoreductase [Pendulispora brunnea]|uniref:SDR family oxidoreductase n=1 Tax=Pendulispora brunnea TaxID=2905690 RepID=A0ABZ2KHB0_9BACT